MIVDRGKILTIKRNPNDKTHPGLWDFPGGKLELGEGISKALKREAREEAGITIDILEPIHAFTEEIHEKQVYIVVFKCRKKSGKVKLSHEHIDFKWVKPGELKKMKTEPYIRDLFRKGAIPL